MDKKIKKFLMDATIAGVTISTILFHDGKQLHTHAEIPPDINMAIETYSVVASGGYSNPNVVLPENIVDLGASPINPSERLFGYKFDLD